MSIQSYSDLVTETKAFLNFSDIDARISGFIRLTESQFEKRLDVREMEKRVTYAIDTSEVELPPDFLRMTSVYNTDNGKKLDYVSIETLESRTARTGAAEKFSIAGNSLIFWPVPTDATNIAFRYQARVSPLSASNPTNDILTAYPDIYFYGTLTNAAVYLREEESISTWSALFQEAIDGANMANRRLVKQTYRMKPSGAPV